MADIIEKISDVVAEEEPLVEMDDVVKSINDPPNEPSEEKEPQPDESSSGSSDHGEVLVTSIEVVDEREESETIDIVGTIDTGDALEVPTQSEQTEQKVVDAGEDGEALQLFKRGTNIRDSVTNEVVDLSSMKLENTDYGPSPSPPLEKREELWSKFPTLEGGETDQAAPVPIPMPPPPLEKAPISPQVSQSEAALVSLKAILDTTPSHLPHSDEFLSYVLRTSEGEASRAADGLRSLHDQLNAISPPSAPDSKEDESKDLWAHLTSKEPQDIDKQVVIDSNEIGITVENVLERTVVHLVKEGSAAQLMGVTAGALLLAVHNSPTYNLSHFETVDALKRAPRPAKLRFRHLPPDLLVTMRDRMQSLVVQTSAHAAVSHFDSAAAMLSPKAAPSSPRSHISPYQFSSPPLPPKTNNDNLDSGHRPAPPSPVVVEWAFEQLKVVCMLFISSLVKDGADQNQQLLMIDVLNSLNESTRRPTRAKANALNTHRLASLTHLVNSLVFGLPGVSSRSPTQDVCPHRQVDWCSNQMQPFLFTLIDVACALLEADCDVPLVYQMAPQSKSNMFFDASLEPVLNDGAAGALLIIAFRAIFHHQLSQAVDVATAISASLASTKCERGRISACRLVLELYYHTSSRVSDSLLLRGIATRLLVQSQEPTIRAAAVTSIQRLGKFATLADLDWLILLCETAASDDDTMVRRGGFEFSLRILHRLPDIFPSNIISFEGIRDADIDLHLLRCKIVAIVQRLVEDSVASVRHAVAAHCASLCTLLGGGRLGEQWSTWIVDTLHTFLRDDDGAVRSAAIDAIPFVTLLLRGFAHYYVYHANMLPSKGEEKVGPCEDGGANLVMPNRVISWNDVASLIRECFKKSGATDVVVSMSVTSMKRTASMLLPALLKLSKEAPDDVRCKVAGAVGQFFVHIQEEALLLELGGCGEEGNTCDDFKKHAWSSLSGDLVCGLITPLVKAIMKDQHLQVVATLFTELAALPQSFSCLDAEGNLVMSRRGILPMSSIYLLTDELFSDSRTVVDVHDAGVHKVCHWATAEIVPESLLITFVTDLEEMTKHRDWRNRAVAIRGVLSFASFATTSSLQTKLSQICIRAMDDKVHAVRLAAAESICLTGLIHQGATPTGTTRSKSLPDWSEAVVIPQLYDLMQRPVARERQLALYMIQILVSLGIVTKDVTIGVLVPLLLNAAQDVVSNVRLSVAKTLFFFMSGSDQASSDNTQESAPFPNDLLAVLAQHSELHRCVDRLCEDEDLDVNYHARQAKSALESLPTNDTP